MPVFVVMVHWHYDGGETLAVFSERSKAEGYMASLKQPGRPISSFSYQITEHILDSPTQPR